MQRASRQPACSGSISSRERFPPCAFSAEAQQINDTETKCQARVGPRGGGEEGGLARLKCCQNTCLAAFSLVSPFHVCCRAAAFPRPLRRRRTPISCFRSRRCKTLIYHMAALHPRTCRGRRVDVYAYGQQKGLKEPLSAGLLGNSCLNLRFRLLKPSSMLRPAIIFTKKIKSRVCAFRWQ